MRCSLGVGFDPVVSKGHGPSFGLTSSGRFSRYSRRHAGKIVQDRAFRPMIAMAMLRKVMQGFHNPLQLRNPALEIRNVPTRDGFDGLTRSSLVTPQAEHLLEVGHRESKAPTTLGESQRVQVVRRIDAIVGEGTCCLWK